MAELRPTFQNIANAIREKNGLTDTYTPDQMPDAIKAIPSGGGGGGSNLLKRFDGTITEVKASDLGNIATLYDGAFEYCKELARVELPDTIEVIGMYAMTSCPQLKYIKLSKNLKELNNNAITGGPECDINCPALIPPEVYDSSISHFNKIYVPGKALDDYYKAPLWGTIYKSALDTNDEYVSILPLKQLVTFDMPATIIVDFKNYATTPQFTIEVDKPGVVNHTERVENSKIYIDLSANGVVDTVNLTLNVPDSNGYVFSSTCAVNVVEKIEPGTYTVEKMSQDTYGFELNSDGFYESTNKKISNSYSYAKVNIKNPSGLKMIVDCINDGESNYDFGMLSNVNTEVSHSTELNATNVYYSFKGLQKPSIQMVEYDNAVGDCFITVKYKKDSSGDSGNDSLQFKIRFEL